MPNAAKNKGKSFERQVAEKLTEVYGVTVMRVWASGAFLGKSNIHRAQKLSDAQITQNTGDIVMPDFLNRFCIECKFYSTISFESFVTQNEQLNKWIGQAEVAGKISLILFKINHRGSFVVFPNYIKNYLKIGNHINYNNYVITTMDGFFENNKQVLIDLNTQPGIIPLNVTVTSSTSGCN